MRPPALWAVCLATVAVFATGVLAGDCGCRGVAMPRIIDGTATPASQWPTVGLLGDSKNGFYCTATVIAPRFVLSAAHCILDGAGKLAVGQTEGRFMLGGVVYKSVHVYAHPTYLGNASQEVEGAIDIALYELDQDIPVTPSVLMRQRPIPGYPMTLVGYGELGTGKRGADGKFPGAGTVTVGRTTLDILTETFAEWRFESKPVPNQESNTAPGDSGGPQFMEIDGQMMIASVTSGGRKTNAGFGDLSYNTRIDIAAPWIDSIIGGKPVPGNIAPVAQSLVADPAAPVPGNTVTFTLAATDADGDSLSYHWFFGDGTENVTGGATESHTYPADGTFFVQVVATDGKGGSSEQQVMLKVGAGTTILPVVPSTVSKQKFSLSFTTPARNSIAFAISNPALAFPSRTDFFNALNGTVIRVFIDNTQIDALTVFNGRPIGSGAINYNYKSGTVAYSLRGNPNLATLLKPFGAENANIATSITVPLRIQVRGVRYGADAPFFYIGKVNQSGVGK